MLFGFFNLGTLEYFFLAFVCLGSFAAVCGAVAYLIYRLLRQDKPKDRPKD